MTDEKRPDVVPEDAVEWRADEHEIFWIMPDGTMGMFVPSTAENEEVE